MSTITSLGATDSGSTSRNTINDNFTNLNTDKVEGQSASVDSEIALFSGTGGKTIKRNSGTGIVKSTSGVISHVTAPSGAIVGDTDSQTLSSKTLTTPTIASFVNATHNHSNAAGGGTIAESVITFTDITTNDVSTTKHGLVPKAPNDTTKFLRGDASWSTVSGTYKFGTFSKDMTTTTTDTIAHGAGATPKLIRIRCIYTSNTTIVESTGSSNGSTESCIYKYYNTNGSTSGVGSDTRAIHYSFNNGTNDADYNRGVITLDSTNITITWTKTGTISASTAYFLWEAYA